MIFGIRRWWGWKKYKVSNVSFENFIRLGDPLSPKKDEVNAIETTNFRVYLNMQGKILCISNIDKKDWYLSEG